jgi:hypothetical protein
MADLKGVLNSILAAGVVSAIISSSVTFGATYFSSSRENDAKMVEMALGILRAVPSENVIAARSWAIRVIDAHSGTPFTSDEKNALLKNAIPYVPSMDFSDPRSSQYLGVIP